MSCFFFKLDSAPLLKLDDEKKDSIMSSSTIFIYAESELQFKDNINILGYVLYTWSNWTMTNSSDGQNMS